MTNSDTTVLLYKPLRNMIIVPINVVQSIHVDSHTFNGIIVFVKNQ